MFVLIFIPGEVEKEEGRRMRRKRSRLLMISGRRREGIRRSRGRRREEMRRKRSRLLMISGRRREEIRRSRSEEESDEVGVRRRIIIK